ncbi:hypothetical protein, conserved [Trypanosoma brucei brucei TREU927]|uniref:Uncharacterized protein n=1 Tax=Trypanosoma brucei brucei (strain 927/4 GUTat10.1) TaxID=185431 RepID=Q385B3_TRYB2|nr:hypothetical protein, conserved [Trypanosoma brucei brucei TREU927]EAN79618.1 hypothetical protein, conserved [Trypanosoma brucei brucei TREU927]
MPTAVRQDSGSSGGPVTAATSQTLTEAVAITEDYVRMLRHTIKQHDAEKLALIERIDSCLKPEQAEAQRLRCEAAQRVEELGKVQRELSETRSMLQEERERANRLMYENVALHAQAGDDRATIAALMKQTAAARSGAQKLPNPTASTSPTRRTTSKRRSGQQTISLRQACATQQHDTTGDEDPYTSNSANELSSPSSALVAALREEVEMLKSLLDAQRAMHETERASRLQEERELERRRTEMTGTHLASIERLHGLHQASLADLIQTRHDMRIENRELRGTVERLQVALSDALATLKEERQKHTVDLQRQRQIADENAKVVTERLRRQLQERRALLITERERYGALLVQRGAELTRLREERTKDKKRLRELEKWRRLEVEGVNSEVNLMRQELRAMQRRMWFSS